MKQVILYSWLKNGALPNANYDIGNKIIYNTEVLKPNLCDYNRVHILVRRDIDITGRRVTQLAFEN